MLARSNSRFWLIVAQCIVLLVLLLQRNADYHCCTAPAMLINGTQVTTKLTCKVPMQFDALGHLSCGKQSDKFGCTWH